MAYLVYQYLIALVSAISPMAQDMVGMSAGISKVVVGEAAHENEPRLAVPSCHGMYDHKHQTH